MTEAERYRIDTRFGELILAIIKQGYRKDPDDDGIISILVNPFIGRCLRMEPEKKSTFHGIPIWIDENIKGEALVVSKHFPPCFFSITNP